MAFENTTGLAIVPATAGPVIVDDVPLVAAASANDRVVVPAMPMVSAPRRYSGLYCR